MNARCAVVCLALLIEAACGSSTPTRPAPARPGADPLAPPPGESSRTITVTDGWSGNPVAAAKVSANDVEILTDAAGQFAVTVDSSRCLDVSVRAEGFLERRTCASAAITLWPVGDDLDAAATRAAAFTGDRRHVTWADVMEVELPPDMPADVVGTWQFAAGEMSRLTSSAMSIQLVRTLSSDEGFVIVPAASPAECGSAAAGNIAVAGFCITRGRAYFVDNIVVPRESIDRPDVALRALASAAGLLNPHPAPGLMNMTKPAAELSRFEEKTLRLLGLRGTMPGVWPDLDQPR